MFQSTHPQGVRRYAAEIALLAVLSFNPRTRRGCDRPEWAIGSHSGPFQSTHPQGVRQCSCLFCRYKELVSIHAPAGGATNTARASLYPQKCFNPRTRRGCDNTARASLYPQKCFNPRTRRGCDPYDLWIEQGLCRFNPRTRRGCDVNRA